MKRSNKFPTETYRCKDRGHALDAMAGVRTLMRIGDCVAVIDSEDHALYRSQYGTTWEFTIIEGEAV
ncbi:hypothetical protein [Nocardia wallacei]|uniref:hypothetical protein n=1 Tax=Nocardia wallacei TaxID=480035 RepID=UPI002454CA42|nr:hypothetical protein [Nocardia wallacei]